MRRALTGRTRRSTTASSAGAAWACSTTTLSNWRSCQSDANLSPVHDFSVYAEHHDPISFKRHHFPPDVIRQAVWPCFRFTMSLRDVEDLLAERGIDVTHETVRCWTNKFGPAIARNIRRSRPRPDSTWHLDEMVVRIADKRMFMWRAVDCEGEVLDVLVQKRRHKAAALKLLRKLLKRQGFRPQKIVTDGLRSYKAAMRDLGCLDRHHPGRLRSAHVNLTTPDSSLFGAVRPNPAPDYPFRLCHSARAVERQICKSVFR